jgi:hypothetical protein
MEIKKNVLKKTFLSFLSIILFSAFNFAGQMPDKYKRKRVGEGVTLLVPTNFVEMSDEEIATKYFTPKRPLAIFRSPDRKAEIGVNSSIFEWGEVGMESEMNMELLKGFYKGAIANSFYEKTDRVFFLSLLELFQKIQMRLLIKVENLVIIKFCIAFIMEKY